MPLFVDYTYGVIFEGHLAEAQPKEKNALPFWVRDSTGEIFDTGIRFERLEVFMEKMNRGKVSNK